MYVGTINLLLVRSTDAKELAVFYLLFYILFTLLCMSSCLHYLVGRSLKPYVLLSWYDRNRIRNWNFGFVHVILPYTKKFRFRDLFWRANGKLCRQLSHFLPYISEIHPVMRFAKIMQQFFVQRTLTGHTICLLTSLIMDADEVYNYLTHKLLRNIHQYTKRILF